MDSQSLEKRRKTANKARLARSEAYAEKVRREFALTVRDILELNKSVPELPEGTMYSFAGAGKRVRDQVEVLMRRLHSVVKLAVEQGISLEWEESNKETDKLLSSLFGKEVLSDGNFSAWTQRNTAARDAFMARHVAGLSLSDRIWRNVRQFQEEMEVAMTVAIGEGQSAAQMSRKVREYLNDPDLMFRRFRYKDENGEWQKKWKKKIIDENGRTRWIDYDRDSYKTGRGMYKSAAKNAMRVTRTETNMAYRSADHERWQQLDFVLGQKIQLSQRHTEEHEDICDKLAGDYPVEFEFTGWHPQCYCFATPILIDESERLKEFHAKLRGETYVPKGEKITEYPQGFKEWVSENKDRISAYKGTSREPYFVRNNAAIVDKMINGSDNKLTIAERAEIRHNARTPEQIDAIQRAWGDREAEMEIAKALGVTYGKPMSFEEANEMRGNPHYKDSYTYRENCQSAVVANEMRRRGLDVEACPWSKSANTATNLLSHKTQLAWEDSNGFTPSPKVIPRKQQYLDEATAEVGRYHLSWEWIRGSTRTERIGHILTAERLSNGSLRIYDPQVGKILEGIEFDKIMHLEVLRVDNLRPRLIVQQDVIRKAGQQGSAPKLSKEAISFWKDRLPYQITDKIRMGGQGEDLGSLMKQISGADGKEKLDIYRKITKSKNLNPVENHKNVWSAISSKAEDYDNLLKAADKGVAHGFEVFILSNSGKGSSADCLLKKNNYIGRYDLKTISGQNSVSNRLSESIEQTNRVLLNFNTTYNGRRLAADIRSYFATSRSAIEVKIFKGKQEISIFRNEALKKDFIKEFSKRWGKIK